MSFQPNFCVCCGAAPPTRCRRLAAHRYAQNSLDRMPYFSTSPLMPARSARMTRANSAADRLGQIALQARSSGSLQRSSAQPCQNGSKPLLASPRESSTPLACSRPSVRRRAMITRASEAFSRWSKASSAQHGSEDLRKDSAGHEVEAGDSSKGALRSMSN